MVTRNEIIEYIAKENILHNIIQNVGGTADEDLKDLEQDIYLDLYSKSEKALNDIYANGQLNFYLARIVSNNIHSSSSRYYTQYKKPKQYNEPIQPEDDDEDED